jgi:tRNA dimethylallyltransferase
MNNNPPSKPKILVVLGPTATGKSNLAVKLAKKLNGEVISADSRQVYKGMDIGSGKITKKEMKGVPHHLLDVANPKKVFSVAEFQKLAEKKIAEILSRGKLPIVCGGTGFYIDTLVSGLRYPEVKENKKLRAKLEKKSTPEVFTILTKLDSARAKTIDKHNKVRLIRAIEIAQSLGKVPKIESNQPYDATYIGLDWPDLTLKERIAARLKRRLKQGMVAEVARLRKSGVSYRRLELFGLEYKNCALFLQKKITKQQLIENILKESFQYAKRQRTWFRRNKKIKWYNASEINNIKI